MKSHSRCLTLGTTINSVMEWDPKVKVLDNTEINLGHQENARIWSELENYLALTKEAAAYAIMDELGYDDMEAFEATLGGTFEEWVLRLGCVELKVDETGHTVMRAKEIVEGPPTKGFTMKFPIKTREDLHVVCVKSPAATITIPEIEFSIGNDGKRAIDTIYNHIGQALFQLEFYASHCEAEKKEAINATVSQLRQCLDNDLEWTWVIEDPSGMSELAKMDTVEVIENQ